MQKRKLVINTWGTHATPIVWRKLGIEQATVKEALGYRNVNAQMGMILGWLKSLGEIELYRRIERAIKTYNTASE